MIVKKVLGFICGIILIAALIFIVLRLTGGFGFGSGRGFGTGESTASVNLTNDTKETEFASANEIVIKVAEDKIYYNGEQVADIEELKSKISDDEAAGATFVLEQEYAIKATMDEVLALLADLEKSIGIKVTYNQ